MENNLEWLATLVSIFCSVFRALNLGYQGWLYLISIGTYVTFIVGALKHLRILHDNHLKLFFFQVGT